MNTGCLKPVEGESASRGSRVCCARVIENKIGYAVQILRDGGCLRAQIPQCFMQSLAEGTGGNDGPKASWLTSCGTHYFLYAMRPIAQNVDELLSLDG